MKRKVVFSLFLGLIISFLSSAQSDRSLWVEEMVQMADPVLTALSRNELKATMPVEQSSFEYGDRSTFAHLEAFGRLMAGMAPWLELGADSTDEGKLRKKYIQLSHKAIYNAINPKGKDYMNFTKGNQPLVDASFLALAFLRAPKQLWHNLPKETKELVIEAFKETRKISNIPYSNWLLFPATIEAFFAKYTDEADYMRMQFAVQKHMEWYVGDGVYSDGKHYHWDYYNSYVIQPMLVDVLAVLKQKKHKLGKLFEKALKREQRYGVILERQISPEGTFPIVGRSAIYRFGAFQSLAQLALLDQLPEKLSYGQVRAGLTAVMKRLHQRHGVYDTKGWLQIGIVGHQPLLAEPYITTGSLYLTSLGFLPLGLPATHPFWTSKPEEWTMVKIWKGDPSVKRDKFSN